MNMNYSNAASEQAPTAAEAAIKNLQFTINAVDTWVRNSRIVLQWQAITHAIEVHKWCESEKAGHDIGWDCAAVSWHMRYGHL